ncbi:sentrin-specific protease 8-like [Gigantopelta aegis]|uniref:sentrin-specific protease 8-like n=1 Tax=Gigantopelta aegis TaxID=1735272 RepID=UPI001B8888CE|nr:sentrin-specific protease 8-like [Gigantopelta aegis]
MAEDEDPIILNFNDSLLRKSDVSLLEGPYWLNDNIIGFCLEYFEKEKFSHSVDRLCLMNPAFVQLIKLSRVEELSILLESLYLPVKQFVFLPVNDNPRDAAGGSHWSLLVYVRSKQEFRHYDSSGNTNSAMAKNLAYKLQPFVHAPLGRMQFIEMDCPQQQNGYDCGLFVIAITEYLCKNFCECVSIPLHEVVNSATVARKRQAIKELIAAVERDQHLSKS